jgi:putative transposase
VLTQVGAIDHNRPSAVSNDEVPARPVRKILDHTTHFHGRFGATFFVTICCERRRVNQLCHDATARVIFETTRRYHSARRWYLKLLLLMPDHLHVLIAIPGDAELSKLIRDFKRITARVAKVGWQRNFFDHRLRHDESEDEKAAYIRANPVRAGLIAEEEPWPFVISEIDLE